MFEIVVKYF